MNRTAVLAFSFLAFPIFFAPACGESDENGTASSDSPTNRLLAAANNKPDEVTREAATVLEKVLTPGELTYLGSLDWHAFTNGVILTDPVSRKAISSLMPLVRNKGLMAALRKMASFNRAYAQTAMDACAKAVENVVSGLMIFSSGGKGCLGGAKAGIPGWQNCLAASMASVAAALNGAQCNIDDANETIGRQAADTALACSSCIEKICWQGPLENCTDADSARICEEAKKSQINFYECMYNASKETNQCIKRISCAAGKDPAPEVTKCFDDYYGPWYDKAADEYFGSPAVSTTICPHYDERIKCAQEWPVTQPVVPCVNPPDDAACDQKIAYELCMTNTDYENVQVICLKAHLP